ncbi:hyaluronan mediated motility receptor-like isoform X3 [Biomphalaria glabrata]|uniref:Hyaluronan mediated motility receptor-like isoform X3 n=1 Tax=Biomphalaria glabrata TaxID=6526 RepID=A0A9W3BL19_BIOGL|nr:hyaluronan mediated motility receptor-like isoform X3 [Biomphalaria glabrata]
MREVTLNQTIQELKTMIVHLEKDKEALSSQLEENWKRIKKIEPFRDVLDNFQMEKKFLLDRDKYTSEQMERLTKEAIKNMGHQNHRQKVKYVKTLKKIAPVIATAQCDSSKMTQTPGEPRIPFKEERRQISCPGEIRQEYEAAIQLIQQKKGRTGKERGGGQ